MKSYRISREHHIRKPLRVTRERYQIVLPRRPNFGEARRGNPPTHPPRSNSWRTKPLASSHGMPFIQNRSSPPRPRAPCASKKDIQTLSPTKPPDQEQARPGEISTTLELPAWVFFAHSRNSEPEEGVQRYVRWPRSNRSVQLGDCHKIAIPRIPGEGGSSGTFGGSFFRRKNKKLKWGNSSLPCLVWNEEEMGEAEERRSQRVTRLL